VGITRAPPACGWGPSKKCRSASPLPGNPVFEHGDKQTEKTTHQSHIKRKNKKIVNSHESNNTLLIHHIIIAGIMIPKRDINSFVATKYDISSIYYLFLNHQTINHIIAINKAKPKNKSKVGLSTREITTLSEELPVVEAKAASHQLNITGLEPSVWFSL